jgi:LAGLIDADG endonuclease
MMIKSQFNFDAFYQRFQVLHPGVPLPSRADLELILGFMDGDGNLHVRKLGHVVIGATQSKGNLEALVYIQRTLRAGIVRGLKRRSAADLWINRYNHVHLVLLLLNGNGVLPTRYARVLLAIKAWNAYATARGLLDLIIEPIEGTVLPSLRGTSWLVGFIVAEGCFSLTIHNIRGRWVSMNSFALVQKYLLNRAVLEYFQRELGIGRVIPCSAPEIYQLVVSSRRELKVLIAYLTEIPLRFDKLLAFNRFVALLDQVEAGAHLNPDTLLALIAETKLVNPVLPRHLHDWCFIIRLGDPIPTPPERGC